MRRLILLFLVLLPLSSWGEIYRWTDSSGQMHFGEQPGPGAERIEVNPQVVERDPATRESQERLRKVLDAHQQEQNAAAQIQASKTAKRNEACRKLRQALASLELGGRYYSESATGERNFYSDQQIDAERSKVASELSANCQ